MNYALLRQLIEESERPRVIRNLAALRDQLSRDVPPKDTEDNLLLATWNIRDLGKVNRRGFGERLPESHFYIAEVLSRFDFVAVQEVNELDEWEAIVGILGPSWDYVATDITDTSLGGNGERLTYAFDRRKVQFRNIAGEIVLPPNKLVSENVEPNPEDAPAVSGEVAGTEVGRQFARSPFVASFQANWFKFDICTVHIYFGDESGRKLRRRISEIREISGYFGERAQKALQRQTALILLGDFNIVDPEHETMEALLDAGFEIPEALHGQASNIYRTKHYDQIAFKTRRGLLEYIETAAEGARANAGVFEIFQNVLTPGQFGDYESAARATPNGDDRSGPELEDYYLDWRTYQFSDHNPMWVRLRVNDSADYLQRLGEP